MYIYIYIYSSGNDNADSGKHGHSGHSQEVPQARGVPLAWVQQVIAEAGVPACMEHAGGASGASVAGVWGI